jgi:Fe-S-cluster containining protein
MTDNNYETWSFKCTQCGKCCTAGPALGVEEVFKYQDTFISGLMFQASFLSNDPRHAPIPGHLDPVGQAKLSGAAGAVYRKDLAEHLKPMLPRIHEIGGTNYLHIYPAEFGYSQAEDATERCPALVDGKLCSLHPDKPARCQAMPLEPMLPEKYQWITISSMQRHGCAMPIDTGDKLVDQGAIVAADFKSSFEKRLGDIREEAKRMQMLVALMQRGAPYLPSFDIVFKHARIQGSMGPLLLLLLSEDELKNARQQTERVRQFIKSQRALINREIAKALERKNKNERPVTAKLRAFLNEYAILERSIPA